ncbi:hypothetical protein ACHQM5_026854 [Ranunculus cassubicifolius]
MASIATVACTVHPWRSRVSPSTSVEKDLGSLRSHSSLIGPSNDRDDVEQYFNYMGMLAVEGTYDKMEALLSQNIHPVDILLLMAVSEGDLPKIEELLRAGANYTVADADGRTALDRAATDEIKQYILGFSVQKA